MRLLKIEVKELFDSFSYPITMITDAPITIIHAPNGYGKTTLLKMIKSAIELKMEELYEIPFAVFNIIFDEDIEITIRRRQANSDSNVLRSSYVRLVYELRCKKETKQFVLDLNERRCEILKEVSVKELLERESIRTHHMTELVREFDESVNEGQAKNYIDIEEMLKNINNGRGIKINFVDSNRLFATFNRNRNDRFVHEEDDTMYRNRHGAVARRMEMAKENIINYSFELMREISRIRSRFSEISERMDRDFPNRLVDYVFSLEAPLSEEEIVCRLDNLERKRDDLEKVGLVLKGNTTVLPKNQSLDSTMLKFYSLYIKDNEEKLRIFDGIKRKLELFLDIINNKTRFSNKSMRIDTRLGLIFEPISTHDGKKNLIPLDKLSSGEKHDFILFYQLIFKSEKNSIVLIDEPEISLHVAWQMEFVNELTKICELNGIQAVIATHSPDIVNGNDDLLVSLGE